MRISTGMIFNSGLTSIQQRTSSLLRTQQQVSSGRRMLTPSDDPVAAARSLEITQSQTLNKQYQASQDNARSALGIMDSQLSSMNDLLTRVRELTVQAGNAALSDRDRKSIATELRTRYDELVALANATDGTGQYLFSGYQGTAKPFAGSVDNGTAYFGDDGARTLQVSGARHLPVSNSGNDVFMRIKDGNGVFATGIQSETSVNASHVTYEGTATLTNPPPTTGKYEMRFWTDTAGTVKTSAQAVASVNPNAAGTGFLPHTFVTGGGPGTDNPIDITIDGVLYSVDLDTSGTGTAYTNTSQIAQAIQSAVGTVATVSVDTTGRLVITNTSKGAPPPAPGSTLAIADGGGGGANSYTALFGAPVPVNGVNGAAGTTYFDLVDPVSGRSLYTNTLSTTGGASNTYTQIYSPATALGLSSAGPFAFDLGATAVFTGTPADGDTFTIERTAAAMTATGKTFKAEAERATIDAGVVTSAVNWSQSTNSGDIELRFWVDAQGVVDTSGQALGTATIPPGLVVTGTANAFRISIDGAAPALVTVPAATYASPGDLVTAINGVLPAGVTVSLDAGYHLVATSSSTGGNSTVVLDNAPANDALAVFFGTPAYKPGITGPVGATYYDLVDLTTGESLYSGAPSATGAGGTYSQPYANLHTTMTGAVDLSGGFTPGALTNPLDLTINGVARSFTIPAGPGAGGAYTFDELQAQLQKQLSPFGVSVGASGNKLVLTSDSVNAAYGVAITLPASNGATALLGAATTSRQSSSVAISLKGTEATPFDFGASVTVTGTPAGGDAFAIKANDDPALGNGYFVTEAKKTAASNMGSGIVGSGEVIDAAKWDSVYNSRQLEVRFWKDPEDTRVDAPVYYDLVDATTEKSLLTDTVSTTGQGGTYTNRIFKSGDAIRFSGLAMPYDDFGVTVTINGTPTSGDVFTLQSSKTSSVFQTLGDLIHAVESPVGPPGSKSNAELHNKLGMALTGIVSAADNFSRVRADIGTRMGEIEDLNSVASNLDLEYASTLSRLQDVDYSKAITDLMRMQMELQAAQQSFTKVSQLSLFNYL